MLVVAKGIPMPTNASVILVLVVQMVSLMNICVILKVLRQVHLWLEILVSVVAIQHGMVLPVAAMVEHVVWVVSRRVRARRAIRRGSVGVRLEEGPAVANRRAVAVVVQVPRVGVLVEILAAGIEPVETIGHHLPDAEDV